MPGRASRCVVDYLCRANAAKGPREGEYIRNVLYQTSPLASLCACLRISGCLWPELSRASRLALAHDDASDDDDTTTWIGLIQSERVRWNETRRQHRMGYRTASEAFNYLTRSTGCTMTFSLAPCPSGVSCFASLSSVLVDVFSLARQHPRQREVSQGWYIDGWRREDVYTQCRDAFPKASAAFSLSHSIQFSAPLEMSSVCLTCATTFWSSATGGLYICIHGYVNAGQICIYLCIYLSIYTLYVGIKCARAKVAQLDSRMNLCRVDGAK